MRLEELRVLLQHFVEDRLAHVGDRRDADVVDQVVADIVGNALGEESEQDSRTRPSSRRCECQSGTSGRGSNVGRDRDLGSCTGASGEAGLRTRSKTGPTSSGDQSRAPCPRSPSATTDTMRRRQVAADESAAGGSVPSLRHPQAFDGVHHLLDADPLEYSVRLTATLGLGAPRAPR